MQKSKTSATVYLLDDDPSARNATTTALMADGYWVRSWASPDAFLEEYDPGERACLVSEIALPGYDGLQLQNVLAQRDRFLPVVFITADTQVATAVQAMRAGAITLLQKPVPISELVGAIEEGLERKDALRQQAASSGAFRSKLNSLTPRERQVFELVVVGKMNKQIAAQLGAAEKTVKVHRGRVMFKMRVRSVAELVTLATQARETSRPSL